jgi:hypothetical protein
VVPGLTLASLALKNARVLQGNAATLTDLGAASLQAALIDVERPEPRDIYHLAPGGATFDLYLVRAIGDLFPDLTVNALNARLLKERYAGFERDPSMRLVQVVHRGRRRIVDIGPAISDAMAPLLDTVAGAVTHLLGDPRSAKAGTYGREIVLTGGGATIPGIDTALLSILTAKGYPTTRVIVPPNPSDLVVRGGWRVANLVTAANWEVLA